MGIAPHSTPDSPPIPQIRRDTSDTVILPFHPKLLSHFKLIAFRIASQM